jgi:hypothetical protein
MRDPQASTWGTSTPTRQTSFKLHIRRSSKLKVERQAEENSHTAESHKELTKLVFRESTGNTENVKAPSSKGKEKASITPVECSKGIILKFDRLHHEKAEVKKKKLRSTFTWEKEKGQKENNHL